MKTDIQKLHDVNLALAKEFVHICDDNGLTYYMLGGTMLGAVRHKGFIPWDDDMDFGMPRKDYESFLAIAPRLISDNLDLLHYKTHPDYRYYIARLQNKYTKVMEIGNGETCASIDIFPLDGSPNNRILRYLFYFRVTYHRLMLALYYGMDVRKGKIIERMMRILISKFSKLSVRKIINPFTHKQKIDKILSIYDMKDSQWSGNIMGTYQIREMIPTAWYGDKSFFCFEGIDIRGIEKYNNYLTRLYGDYMQEKKRTVHYKIIDI